LSPARPAFGAMGTSGTVVGVLFFAALVVGALTSAVSLLEVVVSSAIDILDWPRNRAAIVLGGVIALLGVPAALDTDVLSLMDQIAGNVFLVLGGLSLAIFVGWVMDDPIALVSQGARGVRWFGLWRTLLRFVVPALLAFVLLGSVQAAIEAIRDFRG
jgi:NSS family neurotransmitter:Na+ symporter